MKRGSSDMSMKLVNFQALFFECPEPLLSDEEKMKYFLATLPAEIGMDMISEPHVVRIESAKTPHVGLSAFVPLLQSHAAAESWTELGILHLSIDSCLPLDTERATQFTSTYFQARSTTSWYTEHLIEATAVPTFTL
jgi:S-adenosylmethionine/arginine decarboxylase-like enzyme